MAKNLCRIRAITNITIPVTITSTCHFTLARFSVKEKPKYHVAGCRSRQHAIKARSHRREVDAKAQNIKGKQEKIKGIFRFAFTFAWCE